MPAVHPGIPGPPAECTELKTPLYLKVPFLRRIPIRNNWEENSRAGRLYRRFPTCSVFHHSGVQPVSPPGSISVVTVYDLSALEHPEWHTAETVAYAKREAVMIGNGSRVAAISEWTAGKVSSFFDIPMHRICIVGGAADDIFSPGESSTDTMDRYDLKPGQYLLHVGHLVPRKNIPFLVHTYCRARKRGLDLPLVMVGSRGWGDVTIDDADDVRVISDIDESTLLDLYRGARALLLPSMYEGLGLPALEALACNTPVVASNSTALAETVGEGGMLVSPGESDRWLDAMMALMDPEKMNELRNRAASAERESWRDAAKRLCGFYRIISNPIEHCDTAAIEDGVPEQRV